MSLLMYLCLYIYDFKWNRNLIKSVNVYFKWSSICKSLYTKFNGSFKERNIFVLKLPSGWKIWQRLHANCLARSRTLGVIMCPTKNVHFPGYPEEDLANVV